ncbi:Uncharacterised protein [Mycobacteroides abscessus subsp. abscessus]|nr:Uncharacterised protein [Mycobacteroides abscessus subsp. abscessus]
MVKQICAFPFELFLVAVFCRDDDLCGFLANLFQDFIHTFFKQIGCVGPFRTLFFPLLNYPLQIGKDAVAVLYTFCQSF